MSLSGKVVVVTGASSGIGRATALEAVRRGAEVVLIARNLKALQDVVVEAALLNGRAFPFPCDVSDEEALGDAARQALERFGHFDAWVNCAAVTAFGEFDQVPAEVFRRVIDTNVLGVANGCRAALSHFRTAGSGVIVNVSSVVGRVAQPYASAYTASKFAVRGFTEALRKELYGTGIHVCSVLPESTDTPLFQHGANFMHRDVQPMKPVDSAQKVAAAIVDVIERPRREKVIGPTLRVGQLLHFLGRGLGERLFRRQVASHHFKETAAPESPGNLFRPSTFEAMSGGWKQSPSTSRRFATYGTLALAPLVAYRFAKPWLQDAWSRR